jgi:hypothetical protein
MRQVTARRLRWVDGLFESAAHNLPGKSRLIRFSHRSERGRASVLGEKNTSAGIITYYASSA